MKFIILSFLANVSLGASFESLLQNNSCDRDCVGYCLNYFPHHSILNKCGCMENFSSNEKFLKNKQITGNLVDPIIELYRTKILEIDSQIMISEINKPKEIKQIKTNKTEEDTSSKSEGICSVDDKSCKEKEASCLGTCN